MHFTKQDAFLTRLPSIYHPHDLQHLHLPQFFTPRQRQQRERLYRRFCREAAMVSVVSSWGKPDLVRQYGLPEAKVGTTKFVLGLEIDAAWGQTGSADSTGNRNGTSGGWDLNTDTRTLIEIKHGYTEFDVPWVPGGTRLRLGAQPSAQTMKTGVLATGDFAGGHLSTTVFYDRQFPRPEMGDRCPAYGRAIGGHGAGVRSVQHPPGD